MSTQKMEQDIEPNQFVQFRLDGIFMRSDSSSLELVVDWEAKSIFDEYAENGVLIVKMKPSLKCNIKNLFHGCTLSVEPLVLDNRKCKEILARDLSSLQQVNWNLLPKCHKYLGSC